MALALSKSTFAQEYPDSQKEDNEEDIPTFLAPQQIPRVTTILEKYGFKSSTNKLYQECSKDPLEESKKRKNSKFRYVTPTLYTRTSEDRESLINSKVSLIITQHNQKVPINSEMSEQTNSSELEKYLSHKRCWELNHAIEAKEFIVASLNLSPSKRIVGCLLKNWDEIPSRDKSPERTTTSHNDQLNKVLDSPSTENINLNCENTSLENERIRQCVSPDLFDDDDYDLENIESPNSKHFQDYKSLSPSLKSPPVSKRGVSVCTSEEIVVVDEQSARTPTKSLKSLSQSSFIDSFKPDEFSETVRQKSPTSTMLFKKHSPKRSISLRSLKVSSSPSNYIPITPPGKSSKTQTKISLSQSSIFLNRAAEIPTKSYLEESVSDSLKPDEALASKSETQKLKTLSVNSLDQKSSPGSKPKESPFSETPTEELEASSTASFSKDEIENETASPIFDRKRISHCSFIVDSNQNSSSDDSFKMNIEKINPSPRTSSNKSRTSELSSKCESDTSDKYSGTDCFEAIERDSKGIEYFESFYDPTEKGIGIRNSFVDLTQSSDEDDRPNTPRDKSRRKSQGYKEELIETEKGVIRHENVESFTKNCSNRVSLITKHSSLDSGNISLDYNHTKSLNVTDYVMDILNSQEDTENRDEAANLSQSSCSQESIEILSDEELNYSSRFSAQCKNVNLYDLDNFDDCITADFAGEDAETVHSKLRNKYSQKNEIIGKTVDTNNATSTQTTNEIINKNPPSVYDNDTSTPTVDETPTKSTPKQTKPKEDIPLGSSNFDTPSSNIIIKTTNVTPMLDYDAMDTPNVRKELDKFGIKPVKRRRGVELLKYIYESTHPVVDIEDVNVNSEGGEARPVKKMRLEGAFEKRKEDGINIVGSELIQSENEADFLFERKFSKKVLSCRIPLQIAWFNFLCCNPGLKENILLYEPIQLEVVHSMLKEQSGCNFHIEELITFLDRKCITFRTTQKKTRKKQKKAKT